MPKHPADYDAVVVGAGFSGIRSLWELRQRGLSFKCFEAGADVGGAWYWNCYPGARTDSEAWVYTLNFAPEIREEWNYTERYPSQREVQHFLGRIVDKFHLREYIEFNCRIKSAHYNKETKLWTITAGNGTAVTCQYFLPATGPLSIAKAPPFPGLKTYTGEWYQASNWPKSDVDLRGKRVAIIGTGATGVQIIPKIAPAVKQLTVFQRSPSYVLPGRNYIIDQNQTQEIKCNFDATLYAAKNHPNGLAMKPSGKTVQDARDADKVRQTLDAGWEEGGFHYQFETFDDIFTNAESNETASEYIRQKIRAIVHDPEVAETLCPKYPFLSKRPPCGHFYYEAYNRPNVKLVNISKQEIDLYEKGIRTTSGTEYEFDVIIFAIGYEAATGALSELDVRGLEGKSLGGNWSKRIDTFAGCLVPGFPNLFLICGPHVPFGNMPVVVDIQVNWIGQTIAYMEQKKLACIDVTENAVADWSAELDETFKVTVFAESAKASRSWFVGANIPGKVQTVLFYFGGVPAYTAKLEREISAGWPSMRFIPSTVTNGVGHDVNGI
ncbi:uncharacterized protein TRUGW13939_04443 [Talaromyces rugulosus]|uniref:FAD/NAD(P)-binding domain-containing protein n=1 Tax=Talaromyces rugulosus TaxID=121627 RepID=A0A7H8QUZ9_TALRU|nr:uncharacterized protein TRUGW13939_04443 [Talaromyces rugulosus]QKX57331.1 hypothetical protein TRUGW13939_04443 [Talaromyces rugulosus]